MNKKFGRVLIISNGRLGDFINSFVFINPMKDVADQIDVYCKENYKDIVDNEQNLNGISAEEAFNKQYDILIDLTCTSNTRAIATKVKAHKKIGTYRSLAHKIRSFLQGTYTHSFKSRPNIHSIKYFDPFAEMTGITRHDTPVLRKLSSPTIQSFYGIESLKPIIAIHISATDTIRQIPLHLIKQIIAYTESLGGASVLIGEKDRALEIGLDSSSTYYKEETIPELIAIISQVDYLIGPDSGVLHLAGALGTKTLGIYGPTLSSMYGSPGISVKYLELDLDCRPCKNKINCEYNVRCMNDIEFSDVKKFIDNSLLRATKVIA